MQNPQVFWWPLVCRNQSGFPPFLGQLRFWNPDDLNASPGTSLPTPDWIEEKLQEVCEHLGITRDGHLNRKKLISICEQYGLQTAAGEVSDHVRTRSHQRVRLGFGVAHTKPDLRLTTSLKHKLCLTGRYLESGFLAPACGFLGSLVLNHQTWEAAVAQSGCQPRWHHRVRVLSCDRGVNWNLKTYPRFQAWLLNPRNLLARQ